MARDSTGRAPVNRSGGGHRRCPSIWTKLDSQQGLEVRPRQRRRNVGVIAAHERREAGENNMDIALRIAILDLQEQPADRAIGRAIDLGDITDLHPVRAEELRLRQAQTLHRSDPASVRQEVESAGFRLDWETSVLARGENPHSVKGHTDRFAYRVVRL